METASSRAGITRLNESLSGDRIGIVGLGGTGTYILDYVSKTRVAEIHLFDGDLFRQHNAFRAPGPTNIEELESQPGKAQLFAERYAQMRSGVVSHGFNVEASNVDMLRGLDFVFVSVDNNDTRLWLLPALNEMEVPFVDVGMGIENTDDKLLGILRTSFSETLPTSAAPSGEDRVQDVGQYQRNIQIVELNALNAALAVIRWKKYRGFYLDLGKESRSTYTIDGNHMSNKSIRSAGST